MGANVHYQEYGVNSLELPVRQRDPRNIHVCERCGREYYRRTGNKPERTTRFCSNDCRWGHDLPALVTATALPAHDLASAAKAGDIVGYSASQVRRLAADKRIVAVGGGGRGKSWSISISSLRGYVATAI